MIYQTGPYHQHGPLADGLRAVGLVAATAADDQEEHGS